MGGSGCESVGASGTVEGVAERLAALPLASVVLTARTSKSYSVPLVRSVTSTVRTLPTLVQESGWVPPSSTLRYS